MGYLPRDLDDLIKSAPTVIIKYDAEKEKHKKQPNPKHDQLALFLKSMAEFADQFRKNNPQLPESDIHAFVLGAWICCVEKTDSKSWFFNPEFQEGLIVDTGSILHSILNEELNNTRGNILDEQSKLIFLSQFYKFMFTEGHVFKDADKLSLNDVLGDHPIGQQDLINVIKQVLNQAMIDAIHYGLPTEGAFTTKMLTVDELYKEKKKSSQASIFSFSFFEKQNPNMRRL